MNKSRTLKPKGFSHAPRSTNAVREKYGVAPDPFHATMEFEDMSMEERENELARAIYSPEKTITHEAT